MLYDWNTEERVQNLIEFARLAGLMFTLLSKKYLQTKTKSLKNEQSINAQITPGQCQRSVSKFKWQLKEKKHFLNRKTILHYFFTEKQDSEMRVRECVCVNEGHQADNEN